MASSVFLYGLLTNNAHLQKLMWNFNLGLLTPPQLPKFLKLRGGLQGRRLAHSIVRPWVLISALLPPSSISYRFVLILLDPKAFPSTRPTRMWWQFRLLKLLLCRAAEMDCAPMDVSGRTSNTMLTLSLFCVKCAIFAIQTTFLTLGKHVKVFEFKGKYGFGN